jgi:alpha-L-fucosidase
VYELLAMVRRLQPGILVNNRLAILAEYNRGPRDLWGDFDTPEQRIGSYQYGRAWESCMTLTANPGGWSYHVGARPRGLEACLRALIYCAGGDGNLMWGLGPMPSGEIAPAEVQRLREMGRWLAENGESIYGTRGGPFKPGAWGASTRKGRTIYVHVLKWSGDSVALPKIPPKIVKASLLSGGKAEVEQTDAGIRIAVRPEDRQPIVTSIKLELDALAETVPAI